MDESRRAQLTARQREILQLVLEPMSSKEIGRALGISPGTVDLHIKRAIKTLGAQDRVSAARIAAKLSSTPIPELDTPPPTVAGPNDIASARGDWSGQSFSAGAQGVREEQSPFDFQSTGRFDFPFPVPMRGRKRNDLSVKQRIVMIALIIIGLAVATGLILSAVRTLSDLGRLLAH